MGKHWHFLHQPSALTLLCLEGSSFILSCLLVTQR